jgi:hypothetical protein
MMCEFFSDGAQVDLGFAPAATQDLVGSALPPTPTISLVQHCKVIHG